MVCTTMPVIYMGANGVNSSSRVYTVNTLPNRAISIALELTFLFNDIYYQGRACHGVLRRSEGSIAELIPPAPQPG